MSLHRVLTGDSRWARIEAAEAERSDREQKLLDASRAATAEWESSRAEWLERRRAATARGELFAEPEPTPPPGIGDQLRQLHDERAELRRERQSVMVELSPIIAEMGSGTAYVRERELWAELRETPVVGWDPLVDELHDLAETVEAIYRAVVVVSRASDPTGRLGLAGMTAPPVRTRFDDGELLGWVRHAEFSSLIGLDPIVEEPPASPEPVVETLHPLETVRVISARRVAAEHSRPGEL